MDAFVCIVEVYTSKYVLCNLWMTLYQTRQGQTASCMLSRQLGGNMTNIQVWKELFGWKGVSL